MTWVLNLQLHFLIVFSCRASTILSILWVPLVLHMHAKSLQSCPALCNPMDGSLPGSSVHGILQERILEWVATSSSRGSSQGREEVSKGFCVCLYNEQFNNWHKFGTCVIYFLCPVISGIITKSLQSASCVFILSLRS